MTTVLLQWLKMQKIICMLLHFISKKSFLIHYKFIFLNLVTWPRSCSDWKRTVGGEISSLKLLLGKYVEKESVIRDVLLRIWEKGNRRFLSFLEKSAVRISDSRSWIWDLGTLKPMMNLLKTSCHWSCLSGRRTSEGPGKGKSPDSSSLISLLSP